MSLFARSLRWLLQSLLGLVLLSYALWAAVRFTPPGASAWAYVGVRVVHVLKLAGIALQVVQLRGRRAVADAAVHDVAVGPTGERQCQEQSLFEPRTCG